MRAAWIVLVLGLGGCGAAHMGCDFRDGSLDGPEDRCQDREGLDASTFGATCEALGAEAVSGGCDLAGAVGGCDISEGNPLTTVINYYYSPLTATDGEAECTQDEGTWFTL